MTRRRPMLPGGLALTLLVGLLPAASSSDVQPAIPLVVIIPTLGAGHQFSLDYSVAHVDALLDAIAPDAIAVPDVTQWMRAGCLYRAVLPEHHVALRYARRKAIDILGTRPPPSVSEYEQTVGTVRNQNERYDIPGAVEAEYRARLDEATARIAGELLNASTPQPLAVLIRSRFAERASASTPAQRESAAAAARAAAASLLVLIRDNPRPRWAVLLPWSTAIGTQELLGGESGIRVRPVGEFLAAADSALHARLDAANIAWILSGMLDDWHGMWAPRMFLTDRVAALLGRLRVLAPRHPSTRFLEARWLMQSGDFAAAEPLLTDLFANAGEATFPFPINGKWIRPPWSSVRKKAKLNLAFVRDLRGDREGALRLYRELLAEPALDSEARAAGYVYDDIRSVIEDYTRTPFTGRAEEAFRHYRAKAAIPECRP